MKNVLLVFACLTTVVANAQMGPFQKFSPSEQGFEQTILLDVDGDNDLDNIAVAFAGQVFWATNDGTGNFGSLVPFTGIPGARVGGYLGHADLDGDGIVDLIGKPYDEPSARWYRGNGTPAFEAMDLLPGDASYESTYIEAFDIDQDGDMDLILMNPTGMMALINTDGEGNFAEPISINSVLGALRDLDMADMDGDGDLDLCSVWRFATFSYLYIHEHLDGTGTFGPEDMIVTPPPYISEWGCAWLDADGDGDQDAAISSGGIRYYPNDGMGAFSNALALGQFPTTARGWQPLDMDGDGDRDLVAACGSQVAWVETVSPGVFQTHLSDPFGGTIESTDVGDIDGDGDLDVCIASSTGLMRAWVERVPGGFGAWHIQQLEPTFIADVATADLDGDGDPEVLAAGMTNNTLGWYDNTDGFGAYGTFRVISAAVDSILAIDVADLDADGDMDVLAAVGGSGEVRWFENVDATTDNWTEHVVATGQNIPSQVRAVDLDQDGDQDIVFGTYNGHTVQYCLRTGTSFGAPQIIGDALTPIRSMDIADLNGDMWLDVVIAGRVSTTTNSVVAFMAMPGGTAFGAAQVVVSSTNEAKDVKAADLDNDGDLDLLITSVGRVGWKANDGVGQFGILVYLTTNLQAVKATAIDLDSDGDLDVVGILDLNNGGVVVYAQGGGVFSPSTTIGTTLRFTTDIAVLDMDLDGDPDLVFGEEFNEVGTIENFFGPGYRISGTIFRDLDVNGELDAADTRLSFVPIQAEANFPIVFTDLDGAYTLDLTAGAHVVEAPDPDVCLQLSTDSTAYHELLVPLAPAVTGRDFGYEAVCGSPQFSIVHSNSPGCTGPKSIDIHVTNMGTSLADGILRVVQDPLTNYLSSVPDPFDQQLDTAWYLLGDLQQFLPNTLHLVLNAPGAEYIGDTLNFRADLYAYNIETGSTDTVTYTWQQIVLCAYDPNDKAVTPKGAGTQGLIPMDTERLTYRIRFQNTGNAPATDVVLHDELSPRLDPASIHILGYSHPFTLRVEPDNEALFTFENIMLPDSGSDLLASQGHVIFSIAPFPGLAAGTTIENTAGIVFDQNPPVITNTVLNTLYDCSIAAAQITDLGSNLLQANQGVQYQWALDGTAIPSANGPEYTAIEDGNYTVTVTDSIGCTPTSAPYPLIITGIREHQRGAVTCFPDPFSISTTVLLPFLPMQNESLEVHDMQGRLLKSLPVFGPSIQLSGDGIAPGFLSLRYIRNDGTILQLGKVVHVP